MPSGMMPNDFKELKVIYDISDDLSLSQQNDSTVNQGCDTVDCACCNDCSFDCGGHVSLTNSSVKIKFFSKSLNYQSLSSINITLLNSKLENDPYNTEALQKRAILHEKNGDYSEALEDFKTLYSLVDTEFSDMKCAYLLTKLKQFDDAIELYNKIISKEPHNVIAMMAKYDIYLTLNLKKEAVELLDIILELEPYFLSALKRQSENLITNNKFDLAVIVLTKWLTLEPESKEAISLLHDIKQSLPANCAG